MKKSCLFLGMLTFAVSAFAAEFRIEPEFFNDLKFWRKSLDANTSGRCQITADKTAKNAISETYQLPEAGTYYVWVRSFSYGANSRKFKLFINNKGLGSFGDGVIPSGQETPSLCWEKAKKSLELPAGNLKLQISPISPYSRIDTVILTTDADFVPSNVKTEIDAVTELPPPKMDPGEVAKKLFPHPKAKGNGEAMLVLSGGRPWTGAEFGDCYVDAGAKVLTLTSTHLAGEGGAPIRAMLNDRFEPPAADGVTVEFQRLADYKCVVINNIPAANQEKLLTADRIAALTRFVEDGGTLLLTVNAPSALGDLLPVVEKEGADYDDAVFVDRPEGENFAFLPEKWRSFDPFKNVQAKPGAKVLAQLKSSDGQVISDYIVMQTIGKGRVLFLNDSFSRYNKVAMLYSWAYGRALMAALVNEVAGFKLDVQKLIYRQSPCPEPQTLAAVSTKIAIPEMTLADSEGEVRIDGNSAFFADGAKLEVNGRGAVALTMPGASKPYAVDFKPPQLYLSTTQQKLTSGTSEAVDVQSKGVSKTVWQFDGIAADGKYAVLNYSAVNGAKMQWVFKSGKLGLDGRTYSGIAQKAKILAAPTQVSSLISSCKLDIDATICRRMNCYQPPRGYVEIDLSGKAAADTRPCNFFVSSQPFGYIHTQQGIYAEIIEKPFSTEIRYTVEKGASQVRSETKQLIGRRNAPVEDEFFWQLYSPGKENGCNEYLALWQFVRHHLRQSVGLREYPIRPAAGYTNMATHAEAVEAIKAAGKLGVSFFYLPLCPSSISSLDSDALMERYAQINSCGMKTYPWTACDYTEGTGDWIFQNHQDWLMRDEKGGIYAYFGNHRVIDLANIDFLNWYFEKLKRIFDAGVGYVYLDMGGQASTNVNFAGVESNAGLMNQIPIFKYYHRNDVVCGVEGMNPLVIDNYWYREKLYVPMGGKEFATLGSNLGTNEDASFVLNYFRVAMFGTYPKFFTDGYAQGFERSPGEIAKIDHVAKMLPAIQAALDFGVPFIRTTEYGTTWINGQGGAVYVWDNVGKLDIELPAGYEFCKTQVSDQAMRDFTPDDLKDVKSETIFIIGKKK